jgi:CRISPR system Cascade subunit CasA
LALLSKSDEVLDFVGLRDHQRHAWHAFLVQLAAISQYHAGALDGMADEDTWRSWLRGLTSGADEPFCLCVEDLAKPAFLQPPVPEGTLEKYKEIETPDELDILVTAKNHDLKMWRITSPAPEHWIYSLITLQTMQGFSGRANYGIARMNSGFGNRPCVTRLPSLSLGARFRRDLRVLLDQRAEIVTEHGYRDRGGRALLWLAPWDGKESLLLHHCDPYFLEICRRVRMTSSNDQLRLFRASTESPRLQAGETKGNTGDPWTPVSKDGAGLTIPAAGFDYKRTVDLLFGEDFQKSSVHEYGPEDDPLFYAVAMTRGQGKTEGLHQRAVPLPKRIRGMLGRSASPSGRDRLARTATTRVQDVATVRKKVLKPALQALYQAGPNKLDFTDDRPAKWLSMLESEVDQVFFEHLWRDVDATETDAQRTWQSELYALAQRILRLAQKRIPLPSVRRYRACAASERVLHGAVRNTFPDIFAQRGDKANDGAA